MPWNALIPFATPEVAPASGYGFNPSTALEIFSSGPFPGITTLQIIMYANGTLARFREDAGFGYLNEIGVWSSSAPDELNGADYEVTLEIILSGNLQYNDALILGTYYPLDTLRVWTFNNVIQDSVEDGTVRLTLRDVLTQTTISTRTFPLVLTLGELV